MLIKIAFAGALLFCGMSTAVAQDQSVIAEEYAYLMPAKPSTAEGLIVPIHSRWSFVGCVYRRSQCHHHAHDYGYTRSKVRHNHNLCEDHPHLACFGR